MVAVWGAKGTSPLLGSSVVRMEQNNFMEEKHKNKNENENLIYLKVRNSKVKEIA